jgi:hypothetical protein
MVVNAPSATPLPVDATQAIGRQCVFCLEIIRPGAFVCPHCGSNLAPLQNLADKNAALEERLTALEGEVAAIRTTTEPAGTTSSAHVQATGPSSLMEIKWPHMLDNVFLGLVALLMAHWFATMLPGNSRVVFRFVGLIVALPFGVRFQRNLRGGTSVQVLAALAFGSFGTLLNGVLDIALAGHTPPLLAVHDIVASVAAIALSHYAGSALADMRLRRAEQAATEAAAARQAVSAIGGNAAGSLMHIEPARIKSTAEAVKALYYAAAPLAAGAAALWAAFGHTLF